MTPDGKPSPKLKIPCANNTCGFDPHHRHKEAAWDRKILGCFSFCCKSHLGAVPLLVPALSGIEVTICDERTNSLMQFEQKYFFFSPENQPIYTADGIRNIAEPFWRDCIYRKKSYYHTKSIVVRFRLFGGKMQSDWHYCWLKIRKK